MRAHAAAFLSDVEARPDSPEAGVAHRAAGVTCWFAGQYREARDHLEQALALFQAGRDDDLAFRFGVEPGTAAMVYLAFASWPLGEVDRATSLIDSMQKRIADLTHVGTLAFAIGYVAFFQLMRGDHARAAPNAFELARLVRMQELPMFRAFGVFFEGWATSASGGIGEGLEDMRRGVEQLREQNVLLFDGLLKIALAEAEAAAGDVDRALAILDEALATAERTRLSRVRSGTASGARRNPAQARSRQPRACGRSLPDRHRRREAARRRAASNCARRCRWQSSINRPPAPPTPTPFSRPRSKASRRRRKCPRSPRRRRCSRRSPRRRRSRPRSRSVSDGCDPQTAYGNALIGRSGFGAPETRSRISSRSANWRALAERLPGAL